MLPGSTLRLARARRRTYAILDGGATGDRVSQIVHLTLVTLVLVSVTVVILESVPSLDARFGKLFNAIEALVAVVFTLEYGLRLWASVEHTPLRGLAAWAARWRYARSPAMMVDLLALLPFFLIFFLPDDFRVLLVLRLLRFFKLARYSPGMRSLMDAVVQERRALLACLVILGGLVVMSATIMFKVEGLAQPDRFGTIPDAMWWAIITLTTVGYGDSVPITPLGKVVAGITALGGLVMLALPVGIIATSFAEVIRRREFVVTWSMVARVPLFRELEPGTIAEIIRVMRSQMAATGDVIVRRGDKADRMFVVETGEVELLGSGDRAVKGQGETFGEATLGGQPSAETARALTQVRLLALDAADFHALCESDARLRDRMSASHT
jgi:voltage-gated potassium channel